MARSPEVVPGSPADQAGLRAGDWLVTVDGLVIRDVIDYAFETVDPFLDVVVERDDQRFSVQVEAADQELGLEFVLPGVRGHPRVQQ